MPLINAYTTLIPTVVIQIKLTWHIFLSLISFQKILLSISNWETFLLEKSENIIQHSNGQLDHDDAVRGVVGLTPDIKFSENAMVPMMPSTT